MTVDAFCNALLDGRAGEVEQIFTAYMNKTISVRDTFVRKAYKENFYHGILLGILGYKEGWSVSSNRESGEGVSDITAQVDDADAGIIIEVKYADDGSLEDECKKALRQIDQNRYAEILHQAGIHRILKYGIACRKKSCRVLLET